MPTEAREECGMQWDITQRTTGWGGKRRTLEAAKTDWISSNVTAEKCPEDALNKKSRTPPPQDREMVNLFPSCE